MTAEIVEFPTPEELRADAFYMRVFQPLMSEYLLAMSLAKHSRNRPGQINHIQRIFHKRACDLIPAAREAGCTDVAVILGGLFAHTVHDTKQFLSMLAAVYRQVADEMEGKEK